MVIDVTKSVIGYSHLNLFSRFDEEVKNPGEVEEEQGLENFKYS